MLVMLGIAHSSITLSQPPTSDCLSVTVLAQALLRPALQLTHTVWNDSQLWLKPFYSVRQSSFMQVLILLIHLQLDSRQRVYLIISWNNAS